MLKPLLKPIAFLGLLLLFAVPAKSELPPVPVPTENPITEEKRVLGKMLFWDEQLSSDNSMACGTCHIPASGGVDPRVGIHPGSDGVFNTPDDVRGSPGIVRADVTGVAVEDPDFGFGPQVTSRRSLPVFGALWAEELFWDGHASSEFKDPLTGQVLIATGGALETLALEPILSSVEMAFENRSWVDVTGKLATAVPLGLATNLPPDVSAAIAFDPTYGDLFAAAFGDPAITPTRIAYALATYQRTLVPDQTPWDVYDAGNTTALTADQASGLGIFLSDLSACRACHEIPATTNETFMPTGVRPPAEDLGRQLVTGLTEDRGKFKTPSLRNVGQRPRFMHNGVRTTLEQVIDFYLGINGQQSFPDNQDSHIAIINIPAFARPLLIDFLMNGLRDPRVANETFPFDRPTLRSEVVTSAGGTPFPAAIVLHGAYPNPFNPRTELKFTLMRAAEVRVQILDPRGRLMRTIQLGEQAAGPKAVVWDGLDMRSQPVASGVYPYRIVAGAGVVSGRVTLVR